MPLAQDLKAKLKSKPTWSIKELMELVNSFENALISKLEKEGVLNVFKAQKYTELVKPAPGDVIFTTQLAGQIHPAIVWKIKEGVCFCLVMSSKQAVHNLYKIEHSRVVNGYVSKSIVEIPEEEVKEMFITVYDNKKELRKIFLLAREYYSKLVK